MYEIIYNIKVIKEAYIDGRFTELGQPTYVFMPIPTDLNIL